MCKVGAGGSSAEERVPNTHQALGLNPQHLYKTERAPPSHQKSCKVNTRKTVEIQARRAAAVRASILGVQPSRMVRLGDAAERALGISGCPFLQPGANLQWSQKATEDKVKVKKTRTSRHSQD